MLIDEFWSCYCDSNRNHFGGPPLCQFCPQDVSVTKHAEVHDLQTYGFCIIVICAYGPWNTSSSWSSCGRTARMRISPIDVVSPNQSSARFFTPLVRLHILPDQGFSGEIHSYEHHQPIYAKRLQEKISIHPRLRYFGCHRDRDKKPSNVKRSTSNLQYRKELQYTSSEFNGRAVTIHYFL